MTQQRPALEVTGQQSAVCPLHVLLCPWDVVTAFPQTSPSNGAPVPWLRASGVVRRRFRRRVCLCRMSSGFPSPSWKIRAFCFERVQVFHTSSEDATAGINRTERTFQSESLWCSIKFSFYKSDDSNQATENSPNKGAHEAPSWAAVRGNTGSFFNIFSVRMYWDKWFCCILDQLQVKIIYNISLQ